ncbi:MAG: hypothetical protein WC517_01760 [Patescibacteria group bacterium]
MRIIEPEEKPEKSESAAVADERPGPERGGQRSKKQRRPERRSHFLTRLFFSCLLMAAILIACVAALIFFIAGPFVEAADSVPQGFPKNLVLYELDRAKISIQSPENKDRLAQLLSSLPQWSLGPFLGYLTTDLKTQLAANLQNPDLQPENISLANLEQTLSEQAGQIETVGLKWDNIAKTKEELFDYYKRQLQFEGFDVKEKITDYEIDLSFFKPGVSGAMSIADSFAIDSNSVLKMTINYLSQNQ